MTGDERQALDARIGNEFSGDASTVIQTGFLQGDINVNVPIREDLPTPRQLPPATGHFVNREVDLRRLDEFLKKRMQGSGPAAAVISAVSGAAGIGKTALALHWAHRVRHQFPDGDLFVNLRGYDALAPALPSQVLEDFLRAMNVPSTKMPQDLDSLSALYRSLLAHRSLLIVLDNASTPEQVRPLLPGSALSMVVVTSRSRLTGLAVREGAERVALNTLTPEDSLALLKAIIGNARVEDEVGAAEELAQFCSFLPLALRIVSDRALQRPDESLRSLVEELATEERLLDAFVADDDLSEVRTVLSWSYKSLQSDLALSFRTIGLHPGQEFGPPAIAALLDITEPRARRVLDVLNGIHMVERVGSGRYRLHDLLRAYAIERGEADSSTVERNEAVHRVLTWYLARAHSSHRRILPQGRTIQIGSLGERYQGGGFVDIGEALDWCDLERPNVLESVSVAERYGELELAWKIALSFMGYLERRSYWSDWISSHETAIRAAHALGDLATEAFALMLQGDAFWDRREYSEALVRYMRSIDVSRRAPDRWVEGFALRGCGLTHQELKNFGKAIEFSKEALSTFREIGEVRGEGMALLSLGVARRGLMQLDGAIRDLDSAIRIFLTLENMWSVALARYHAAITFAQKVEHPRALEEFFQALDNFRAAGDRRHEAWVLREMAFSLTAMGSLDAAKRARMHALQILADLGDPDADDLRRLLQE
ncbi:NB-ARC domain-containing protein [Dactylosporangium sp. NPDC005555]|uniref:ATP-binding protein n=1 Tax=Dactylosporangium sp. NPDC005555 TaxID=3154889 RepID=UPI0033A75668